MEASPQARERNPRLATLSTVLLVLGILAAVAVVALRLVSGIRHFAGLPTYLIMMALFIASGVARSFSQGATRMAWVSTAISLLAFTGLVLVELFVPD